MKQQTSAYAFAGVIVGLLVLVMIRPWGKLNRSVGIVTATDLFRADSASHRNGGPAGRDSLMIQDVAVMMPPVNSGSLTDSVDARQKRKALLEQQSAWLQKENQRLDTKIKVQKRAVQQKQQTLVSLGDIDQLLSKQNPNTHKDARHLEVSDLETELNTRTSGKATRPAERRDP